MMDRHNTPSRRHRARLSRGDHAKISVVADGYLVLLALFACRNRALG